jgi:hypothetical protein
MTQLYQNDQTTFVFRAGADLDQADTVYVLIEKPSGVTIQRDAEVFANEVHWFSGTDLNEAGTYSAQLVVHSSYGTHVEFEVLPAGKIEILPGPGTPMEEEPKVYLDTIRGTPGTAFPSGTVVNPVNNYRDAYAIAQNRGIHAIYDMSNDGELAGDRICPEMAALEEKLKKFDSK